ncbi:programmed cell death protein 1 [Hyperolius riggenbachi]|uniref:programmed cell death protein 1 n=1 Tax=Hyperolius riggenbachi TaxID=752182 RepID=UPI0035A2F2A0
MSMERLCLIFCSICVSSLLKSVTAEGLVKFIHSPPELRVKEGDTAVFTCNITYLNYNPSDINWYLDKNGIASKVADVQSLKDKRLNITTYWNERKAVLHIRNVTQNDSGKYHCEHVDVFNNGLIIGSNSSELILLHIGHTTPTVTNQTTQETSPDHKDRTKVITISISVLMFVLLLLLIGITIILVWHKQRNMSPQPQLRHLEKPPQDTEVYTVDYGVIEFGNNQPCRKSAEVSVSEQVEYATIMFPQGTPCMGERRERAV